MSSLSCEQPDTSGTLPLTVATPHTLLLVHDRIYIRTYMVLGTQGKKGALVASSRDAHSSSVNRNRYFVRFVLYNAGLVYIGLLDGIKAGM